MSPYGVKSIDEIKKKKGNKKKKLVKAIKKGLGNLREYLGNLDWSDFDD